MAALQDPATAHASADLDFHARLALLVQREVDWRDDKRLARLLKAAQRNDNVALGSAYWFLLAECFLLPTTAE